MNAIQILNRADCWESAAQAAKSKAPGSDADLLVAGYVAGLRSAGLYARELEFDLQAALNCKPSGLSDWKREVRRKYPELKL